MLLAGKILGPVLFLLILIMIIAGMSRKKIGLNFLKYHRTGAMILFLVMAAHGTILFLKVGPPDTTWHLCGTFGAVSAFAAMVVALMRKKIGSSFLFVHQIFAFSALVLAILHRVIAFM